MEISSQYRSTLESKIARVKNSKNHISKRNTFYCNLLNITHQKLVHSLFWLQKNLTDQEMKEIYEKVVKWKAPDEARARWFYSLVKEKSKEMKV